MGEAKRRGTFEVGKAQAIAKQESARAKLGNMMTSMKQREHPRQLTVLEAMSVLSMLQRPRPKLPLIAVKKIMTSEKAMEMIFSELRAAEKKHPGWPDDVIHAVGIMAEEAGEAMKEAIDIFYTGKQNGDLKKELAQTGAMAIRALINLR